MSHGRWSDLRERAIPLVDAGWTAESIAAGLSIELDWAHDLVCEIRSRREVDAYVQRATAVMDSGGWPTRDDAKRGGRYVAAIYLTAIGAVAAITYAIVWGVVP